MVQSFTTDLAQKKYLYHGSAFHDKISLNKRLNHGLTFYYRIGLDKNLKYMVQSFTYMYNITNM